MTTAVAFLRKCSDLPDKILAVAAEGRMLEEPRDELVVLDFVDVLLLQRALPLTVDVTFLAAFETVRLLFVVGTHITNFKKIEMRLLE